MGKTARTVIYALTALAAPFLFVLSAMGALQDLGPGIMVVVIGVLMGVEVMAAKGTPSDKAIVTERVIVTGNSEGELELDFERFEYQETSTLGGDSYYVKVGCRHREPLPVRSVASEVVAMLCTDCDGQLPVTRS